jgi:putative N6-adenine-specific DNA methylase
MVTKKVRCAIGDDLKRVKGPRRPPKEAAGVWVRIVGDRAEISVDASGEHLHRRGWATHRTEAPLRENLAAGVLRGCGWHPGLPLVDPMCGSGTLLLEGATLVAGVAAGSRRAFAFERWPCHEAEAWSKLKRSTEPLGVESAFWGFDRDPRAIDAARSNAKRAGVSLALEVADVGDLVPPCEDLGWVITNPPYGQRIGKGREKAVLQRFGRALADRFSGWGVAVVLPSQLVRHVGLELEAVLRFRNGGLSVVVAAGVVP